MTEREPTPDVLRLWQSGIIAIIEAGVKPSDLIKILNSKVHPECIRVGWDAYETIATPELKVRVQKVQEALEILSKFDQALDPKP